MMISYSNVSILSSDMTAYPQGYKDKSVVLQALIPDRYAEIHFLCHSSHLNRSRSDSWKKKGGFEIACSLPI